MGYGSWSDNASRTLTSSYISKSTDDIFVQNRERKISNGMDPKDLKVRESRDSEQHPNSLAIMLFLDETGSMGQVPEMIVRKKLDKLMNKLIESGVEDAHVFFGGIGDQYSDRAPLQVGQFEAETELLHKWLTSIYLEGGGGGGNHESYLLAWLVAARHTAIDCMEKRNQKGFLFTVGDERSHANVNADVLEQVLGYTDAERMTDEQLLNEAKEKYNVYHIHVQQGSYRDNPTTLGYWRDLLGEENLIILENYEDICDVIAEKIVSVLEIA